MTWSHGSKSAMLGCKFHSGASKTKQLIPVQADLQLTGSPTRLFKGKALGFYYN